MCYSDVTRYLKRNSIDTMRLTFIFAADQLLQLATPEFKKKIERRFSCIATPPRCPEAEAIAPHHPERDRLTLEVITHYVDGLSFTVTPLELGSNDWVLSISDSSSHISPHSPYSINLSPFNLQQEKVIILQPMLIRMFQLAEKAAVIGIRRDSIEVLPLTDESVISFERGELTLCDFTIERNALNRIGSAKSALSFALRNASLQPITLRHDQSLEEYCERALFYYAHASSTEHYKLSVHQLSNFSPKHLAQLKLLTKDRIENHHAAVLASIFSNCLLQHLYQKVSKYVFKHKINELFLTLIYPENSTKEPHSFKSMTIHLLDELAKKSRFFLPPNQDLPSFSDNLVFATRHAHIYGRILRDSSYIHIFKLFERSQLSKAEVEACSHTANLLNFHSTVIKEELHRYVEQKRMQQIV